MTLGELLRSHRDTCTAQPPCTRDYACPGYLNITRNWTERRQRWQRPQWACLVFTIRENP